jgi:hypothetical protein
VTRLPAAQIDERARVPTTRLLAVDGMAGEEVEILAPPVVRWNAARAVPPLR